MRKIGIVLLLALCVVLGSTAVAWAGVYEDTEGHWAEAAIETWSERKVIQGSGGFFRPDDGIIRGEMALILDRIFHYSDIAENPFSDLADTWYTEAVLKVNAAGVMLGYQDKVRPEDNITREEALAMIARTVGLDDLALEGPLPYADVAQVSDWALPVVTTMTLEGYITDSPVDFRPKEAITRAEVVVILDNMIQYLQRSNGLFTTYVEGNAVLAGERVQLLNSHITGDLFIAGGATTQVVLENTVVDGRIFNESNAQVTTLLEDQVFFGSQVVPAAKDVPLNTYLPEAFFRDEKGRIGYTAAETESGIDVSEWQGEIDWQTAAADGLDFAIMRLGYRGYTSGKVFMDACYTQNMEGARDAGLKLGVYFFSQAISVEEAVEEARFVLDNLGDYDLDYPIVYDWETAGAADARTNGLNNTVLTDCALAFCRTIEEAGYEAVIYLYGDLAYTRYELNRLTDYDWWFAGYSSTPEFYYDFRIWQYTSSGRVMGIEGKVDMDLCFDPYAQGL